jgi:hypothetical protein
MTAFFAVDRVMAWWNMGDACKTFHDGPKDKANCIWGAISSTISLGAAMIATYKAGVAFKIVLNELGNQFGNFKKRDTVDAAVLDELTTFLGSPVSYRGVYQHNHTTTQDSTYHHVFHIQHNDTDYHFAHMGNATGLPHFRIGLGPGIPSNLSPAKRDQYSKYMDYYFTSGGIDFYADPNPDNFNYDRAKIIDPRKDFDWIFGRVACTTQYNLDSDGYWFQLYDELHKGTMLAGSIAPIGPDRSVSPIFQNPLKGGIKPWC